MHVGLTAASAAAIVLLFHLLCHVIPTRATLPHQVNPCDSGEFHEDGGCSDCPAGFFMSHTSHYLVRCDICGAGRFSRVAASTCIDCPQGYFTNQNRQGECVACALGYYQPNAKKYTCKACDTGKHTDQTAQPQCKNCAVGTYLNEMGQSTCKVCAVGKMQDEEGQSLCKDCLLMEFASAQGQSSCASCSAGQYQNEIGQTGCKLYPSGGSTGWATDTDWRERRKTLNAVIFLYLYINEGQ